MAQRVVVLDNGGGFCKAGFGGEKDPVAVLPNCVARPQSANYKRWLVGDQIQLCHDIKSMGIRRALDRGYVVNPELEKEIWDRIFRTLLKIHPSDCGLLLLEPLFNLPSIQKAVDELVFEDFGFHSLYVGDSPSLTHVYQAHQLPSSLLARSDCSLIVDSGFSFTHVAPVFQKFTCNYAAKRIDLGGKALTNYLKELVSYRAWNMMDETLIMEDVKEKLCYCSLDVASDLEVARKRGIDNFIQSKYVLPDGIKHKRGFVKDPDAAEAAFLQSRNDSQDGLLKKEEKQNGNLQDVKILNADATTTQASAKETQEQEITLANERFLVPEMLFHPADLGMHQAGLAESIILAVNSCHPDLHPLLYNSVVLTGGSTLFPRFKERLEKDLRPLVADDYQLNLHVVDEPIVAAWRGGALFAASSQYEDCTVTKEEYEELGSFRCRRRFLH